MNYRTLLNTCPDVPDRERLLNSLCGWSFGEFVRRENEEADPRTEARFRAGIERLRAHEPLQYILGEAPFYGRMFSVDSRVLIPRFDTEILLQEALRCIEEIETEGTMEPKVLDLCTGSGCLAVTMKAERPEISAAASDLMENALIVAKENERRILEGSGRIEWIRSDLFQDIRGRFDLIVTNPPYIRTTEIGTLDPEVRAHEPLNALDGGADGLEFVRKISREARAHLSLNGRLLMEIGDEEGPDALGIFREDGYRDIRILRDLAGRDRVLSARKGSE